MKLHTLKNGINVIFEKRPSQSVAIEICIHVGSNNEEKNEFGVSHFIEHLLFEGTLKRANSMLISNEIEKIGGEINAATSNERTFYYAKVPKKHFSVALDVLSDMVQNPLFSQESIEKERKIILDEINMVTDEPRFHQWVLFQKALFKNHPAKNPVYGTKEIIKNVTRQEIIDYYKKFYIPTNITVSVVGGVSGVMSQIKNSFNRMPASPKIIKSRINEPAQIQAKTVKEKKQIMQSYMVLGYKTPPRSHRDSYVLDVIKGHLGRGQSGKLFQEIRVKHGLAYDVGAVHEPSIDFGLFAIYLGTNKKNLNKCKTIILKEFEMLQNLTEAELIDAINFTEGEHLLSNEDNFKFANLLSFYNLTDNPKAALNYINRIKKVTLSDVKRVAKKYLTKKYTSAIIEQKK